jgi:NAD(P)-dependent dehydrogenase (short-subunit alcohol dehydrogenase family)
MRGDELAERSAIVTGGARGIGRAIALALQARGARVAITSRDRQAALDTAAAIPGAIGLDCEASDARSVDAMVDAAMVAFGRIDILVANAGVAPPPARIEDTREEDWDRTLAVNLKGPFLCARAVVPHMKRAGRGRIVMIGSTGALQTFTTLLPYAAAKGGLVAMTKMLALELAPAGITVNAVLPGPVRTEMLETVIPEDKKAALAAAIPAGRMGAPEEIASAVAFLCSDEAAWITGEALVVAGGWPGRALVAPA